MTLSWFWLPTGQQVCHIDNIIVSMRTQYTLACKRPCGTRSMEKGTAAIMHRAGHRINTYYVFHNTSQVVFLPSVTPPVALLAMIVHVCPCSI